MDIGQILKNGSDTLYRNFQRTLHKPRNKNILSSVFLGGKFLMLAKENILRIPNCTGDRVRRKRITEREGRQETSSTAK